MVCFNMCSIYMDTLQKATLQGHQEDKMASEEPYRHPLILPGGICCVVAEADKPPDVKSSSCKVMKARQQHGGLACRVELPYGCKSHA